jgi:hypothetical protein
MAMQGKHELESRAGASGVPPTCRAAFSRTPRNTGIICKNETADAPALDPGIGCLLTERRCFSPWPRGKVRHKHERLVSRF